MTIQRLATISEQDIKPKKCPLSEDSDKIRKSTNRTEILAINEFRSETVSKKGKKALDLKQSAL